MMEVGNRVRCIREFQGNPRRGVLNREYTIVRVTANRNGIELEGLPGTQSTERFELVRPVPVPVVEPVVNPVPVRRGTPIVFFAQVVQFEDDEDDRRVVTGDTEHDLRDSVADAGDEEYYTVGRPKKITVYI